MDQKPPDENGPLPSGLQEIVADFAILDGREKLEYLLEFAESLPPLPDWLEGKQGEMDQVHECMTPVFIFAEARNGRLTYHFDVPRESPTVRGYAAILQTGLDGLRPADVLQVPAEFYLEMGLQSVLTSQRMSGIWAILAHMKDLARPHVPGA